MDRCGTGSGLWIARREDDLIVYDHDAATRHAQHIVLHEIGHMLLEHDRPRLDDGRGADAREDALMSGLLGSIDPDTVRSVLCRSDYRTEIEQEAEAFADAAMLAAAGRATGSTMRQSLLGGGTR